MHVQLYRNVRIKRRAGNISLCQRRAVLPPNNLVTMVGDKETIKYFGARNITIIY